MSNEEAITSLQRLRDCYKAAILAGVRRGDGKSTASFRRFIDSLVNLEALEMAINALKEAGQGGDLMDSEYKEVYFHEYCKKCKHEKAQDINDPCDECLENPTNLYSHVPVKFEKKEK